MLQHNLLQRKNYFPNKFKIKLSRIILSKQYSSEIIDESSKKSKVNKNDLNKMYSDTLLLPKTNFPLRADAVNREILFRDKCSKDLYQWQVFILSKKKFFFFFLSFFDTRFLFFLLFYFFFF